MSEPAPPVGRRARASARRFTALQLVLFAGTGLVGLAALLAAGLAFGLALAGAAMIAVVVLAVWFIATNLIDGERPAPPHAAGAQAFLIQIGSKTLQTLE